MEVTCEACRHAYEERAAIHEYDGHATRPEAERMAQGTRCAEHEPSLKQDELLKL
jgi:hypothetical protein